MAWTTPKTDWAVNYDEDGNYTGDFFNAVDFNRIKNNLEYLKDLGCRLYPPFTIEDLGSDRTYSDFVYADEINSVEQNLITINSNTVNLAEYNIQPPELPVYSENGIFIDPPELNRIESATLKIYNLLIKQYTSRRMLTFTLGLPNDGYLHGGTHKNQ